MFGLWGVTECLIKLVLLSRVRRRWILASLPPLPLPLKCSYSISSCPTHECGSGWPSWPLPLPHPWLLCLFFFYEFVRISVTRVPTDGRATPPINLKVERLLRCCVGLRLVRLNLYSYLYDLEQCYATICICSECHRSISTLCHFHPNSLSALRLPIGREVVLVRDFFILLSLGWSFLSS